MAKFRFFDCELNLIPPCLVPRHSLPSNYHIYKPSPRHPVILSTTLQRPLLTKGVSPPPWCPLPFSCFPWVPDSCLLWKNPHFSGIPDQLQSPLISSRLGPQPISIGHLSWHCLNFTKYLGLSRLEASIFDAIRGGGHSLGL